ncbi:MAG: permease-like cell division protein FtsX [Actinomycetota bacterium]
MAVLFRAIAAGTFDDVGVFFNASVTAEQLEHVEDVLHRLPSVTSVRIETGEETFRRFASAFGHSFRAAVAKATSRRIADSLRVGLKHQLDSVRLRSVAGNLPGVATIVETRSLLRAALDAVRSYLGLNSNAVTHCSDVLRGKRFETV